MYREKCAVKNCKSTSVTDVNISFFRFPQPKTSFVNMYNYFGKVQKIDRATAWKKATNVKFVLPKSKVCSLHFGVSKEVIFVEKLTCLH